MLFAESERQPDGSLVLTGHRLRHLREILKTSPGDTVRLGQINGLMGTGTLRALNDQQAILDRVQLNTPSPQPLPVTLILALPRPKMLKRVLQCATAMGVKRFYLINSYKVEKSFWSSPWLSPEKIEENLTLGLEQAQDTCLPEVHLHKRFKPFVEDLVPAIAEKSRKLIAHPYTDGYCPEGLSEPTTLAIGPEGGFTPYEVAKFNEQGFETIRMGQRILRVETAVPALLAKLFPFS